MREVDEREENCASSNGHLFYFEGVARMVMGTFSREGFDKPSKF